MANRPIDNNELFDDEENPEFEDELELSYTISESDMVVDLDDYDPEEVGSDDEWEEELAEGTLYDTQHTDGSTHDPEEAWEQGLVYIPPEDPPVLPSDEQQGVEIAVGFAPSMEETDPDDVDLPSSVDNSAFDLQEDIYIAIRNNSETSNLADRIRINVVDGVVILEGIVPDDLDVANIDDIVSDLEGVEELDNRLETEV
jgi:hypothetical protein